MYDPKKQYRCTIIRGKAVNKLDDLLPLYAQIINDVCPCKKEIFAEKFNEKLNLFLNSTRDTLDNHRTEIAGKLFGMYYVNEDDYIIPSERMLKFLADNDQPAFFKEMCYKMQFPNGTQKTQTIKQRVIDGISVRPYSYVLKILKLIEEYNVYLTVKNIGYYILNSLDVLCRNATTDEVSNVIISDFQNNQLKELEITRNESYDLQHIREQINYLELANLVYYEHGFVKLNHREDTIINLMADEWNVPPAFDISMTDLIDSQSKRELALRWGKYYSSLSKKCMLFKTDINALLTDIQVPETRQENQLISENTTAFGDDGERIVFQYERKRVEEFNPRMVNKVLSLGKVHGIGYDIQSVVAENGEDSDFVKYIEVKSTKRVTIPDIEDSNWKDNVNLTRNEYIASEQHAKYYSVYRVYFTRNGVFIYEINNLKEKKANGIVRIVPTMYNMDFDKDSIDSVVEVEQC